MNSAIDQVVVEVSHEFVARLGSLNEDPYIREAVMKLAVREVTWALLETFGDEYALSEQLELMADLVRSHKEDKEARR